MLKRVLRKVFVRISSLFGIPEIQARLDRLDHDQQQLDRHLNRQNDHVNAFTGQVERRFVDLSGAIRAEFASSISSSLAGLEQRIGAHFENRLTSLNEALVGHVEALGVQVLADASSAVASVKNEVALVRQNLDTVRRRVEAAGAVPSTAQTRADAPPRDDAPVIDDALYVSLENHFRGSRDLVAERQATYIPMLPTVISASSPVVDLGCGRGEWLAVLASRGIPALGVDSNAVCIAECRENGNNAELADLVGFLRNRPDASVGAYTLFQVLEHLPFPVLLETMREMRRTLVPGGRVIAEVPNAKNLRVTAGTFWIDPTHQRPLYPEFLLFLAQEVGFSSADSLYLNDDSPKLDLSGLPEGARIAMERVLEAIDTARDFALVATA